MPRLLPAFSLLFLLLSPAVGADTLAVPAPAQEGTAAPATAEPEVYSVRLPGRGMTMEQVEAKFGAPRERLPEVGEPPITRWIYDDFTVYFEYQYVINAIPNVVRPAPAAEPPAAPAETDADHNTH